MLRLKKVSKLYTKKMNKNYSLRSQSQNKHSSYIHLTINFKSLFVIFLMFKSLLLVLLLRIILRCRKKMERVLFLVPHHCLKYDQLCLISNKMISWAARRSRDLQSPTNSIYSDPAQSESLDQIMVKTWKHNRPNVTFLYIHC